MIFFDLEFYVPREYRKKNDRLSTLFFNPTFHDHIILGGHFIIKDLNSSNIRKEISFWTWDDEIGCESTLLGKIYELFSKEWCNEKEQKNHIMKKTIKDLITVGIGIGRIDLPSLFIRSSHHKIKSRARLYETYLNTKVIDLTNVASFLFPEDQSLYPKTANEIMSTLFPESDEKEPGRSVWKCYENNEYKQIEKRCKEEVEQIFSAYEKLGNLIKH